MCIECDDVNCVRLLCRVGKFFVVKMSTNSGNVLSNFEQFKMIYGTQRKQKTEIGRAELDSCIAVKESRICHVVAGESYDIPI